MDNDKIEKIAINIFDCWVGYNQTHLAGAPSAEVTSCTESPNKTSRRQTEEADSPPPAESSTVGDADGSDGTCRVILLYLSMK